MTLDTLSLTSPISPFLAVKRLEFLRNAAVHLDRNMHDDDFFIAVASLVRTRAEAVRLCAPAFAADGKDSWGRDIKREAQLSPQTRQTIDKVTSHLNAEVIPEVVNNDEDIPFFYDDDDFPGFEDDLDDGDTSKIPPGSPFSRSRPISVSLTSVWRETNGIEPLRRNVAALVDKSLAEFRTKAAVRRDPVRTRISKLRKLLRLSAVETDLLILLHLFYQEQCDWFRHLTPTPFPSSRGQNAFIRVAAAVTGSNVDSVRSALTDESPLLRYGIVNEEDFALSRRIVRLLSGIGSGDPRSIFFRPVEGKPLPWEFFPEELRAHGETIAALARADRGGRGLDILLHGIAGAGKTSFALALAEHLGLRAVGVAIDKTEADDPRRRDLLSNGGSQAAYRLGALALAEKQCDPDRDVLVIDEADTLLCSAGANRLNRTLDSGRCVRLWLGNLDPHDLPDSNLRRFDYAIEFEPLGARERTCIWRNSASRFGLDKTFTEEDFRTFAERFPVSAGGISRICENLSATGIADREGREAAIALANRLLESHAKLLGVKFRPGADGKRVSAGYVLDGLSIKGDVSLPDLLAASREHLRRLSDEDKGDGAARRDPPRLNILLSGPPGCGKTEFVRWLGEQLGRKVVALGASDLMDKFVGETEKRIARAFRNAERDGAVLFFDEVDSFLRSRASATHSWEITETNEILARLEDFKGLFVAATNYPSSLDPAVLRRFTFKMSFDFLDNAGKRLFFSRFFADPLTDAEAAELDAIQNLCPGDFRTVRQRLDYLPGGATNARRLDALREESARKADLPSGEFGVPRRAVGF